jgi:ankyrin repeat protein
MTKETSIFDGLWCLIRHASLYGCSIPQGNFGRAQPRLALVSKHDQNKIGVHSVDYKGTFSERAKGMSAEPLWGGGFRRQNPEGPPAKEVHRAVDPFRRDVAREQPLSNEGTMALDFVRPRSQLSLDDLPNEILFAIFKQLLRIDPITLLGAIPGTSHRLRSIAFNTIGTAPSFEDLYNAETRKRLHGYIEKWESPLSLQLAARFPMISDLVKMISVSNSFQEPSIVSAFAANFDADLADETRGGLRLELQAAKALLAAYKKTPEAIKKGAEAVLEYVCDPDRINGSDRFGRTPLAIAIQYNSVAAVKHLLARGAFVNYRVDDFWTEEKSTLLALACVHASQEIVGALVGSGRCNPNFRDEDYGTALNWLADLGRKDDMTFLIEQCKKNGLQIDLEEMDDSGQTALALACRGNSPSCAEYLIEQGARTDVLNNSGLTPLALACLGLSRFNFSGIVNRECDTDAEARRLELVQMLIRKGVNVDVTALISAVMQNVATKKRECRETAKKIEDLVVAKLKTQPNAPVVFHGALFSVFLKQEYGLGEYGIDCKKRLVELGTGILTPDALNQALRNAIEVARPFSDERRRYFQALKKAGADPNILIDLDRETLLTHLVKEYYDEDLQAGILIGSLYLMYKMLVDLGADPSLRNANGDTPLDLVETFYAGNPSLDRFLAKVKVDPLPDWQDPV